jgi:adenosylcobinamide-GDP ribazoletransferase
MLVGAFGAAVLWAASRLWSAPVAVVLSMVATVWLTGAFHEDGLADTCDALGGSASRERALAIMKDSRIGAYGAIGLVLVLGLKAAALAAMPLALALPALVLAHTASRTATVLAMRVLPYAGDVEHAKAKPLARSVGSAEAGWALAWLALLCAALLMGDAMDARRLAAALAGTAAAATACALWLRRRLGGYTGDGLGATQQFGELAALLGASMALGEGLSA